MVAGERSQREVIALYTRLLEAWNGRDPDAFAGLFTRTGSVVGFDGSEMYGPSQIRSELHAIFESHQTAAYVAKVREVRQFDSKVVLLRAAVGMVPPGKTELNPAVNALQSLLAVFESGQARIAYLQSTPAAFHGRPHLSEQLTAELTEVLRSGQTVVEGG